MTEVTDFVKEFLTDVETASALKLVMDKIPTQMLMMMIVVIVVGLVGSVLKLIFDAL